MRLSIIIVHYRTPDDLRACLESLHEHPLAPQVIVVDNGGEEASGRDVVAQFPGVDYLPQAENRWFCGGNNAGLAVATGDYALLLNPDTVVPPGALEAMVDFMDSHPDYRGATVQLRYPDGTLQRTCSRIPTYAYLLANHTPLGWLLPGWKARLNHYHWYGNWERDTDRDVEVMPGSCLLMRRGDLRLNPDLLLYFPEDDLARRFAGEKFRYLSGIHIIHREKAATQSWLATRVYFRDMLIYTRQHHGDFAALILWKLTRPLLWGMRLKRLLRPSR